MTDVPAATNGFEIVRLSGKCVGRLRQNATAFAASLNGFILGVCLGWNSSASESFKEYIDADAVQLGLVGGIFNVGACIGVASLAIATRRFHSTTLMLVSGSIVFVGWILVVYSERSIPFLIAGRFLCGFSATSCVLVPLYIGWIADKDIRGQLLSSFQLSINFGVAFSFTVAYLVEEDTVWLSSILCAVTTALTGFSILLPKSSMQHVLDNEEDRAFERLEFFRGRDEPSNAEEFEAVKRMAKIEESKRQTLFASMLRKRKNLRKFIVLLGVMTMYQLSCINPLIFYALLIFKMGGSADLSPEMQTLVVGYAQNIGCLVACCLVDIIGRKLLLIASSLLVGFCLFMLGWFFNAQMEDPEYADNLSWMPLTWIALFFVSFNLGIGPVTWVLLGELFPVKPRTEVAVIVVFLGWLLSLAMTLFFGEFLEGLGVSQTLWLFAGICWSGAAFAVFVVPESRRRSFVDLEGDETEEETPSAQL